VWNRKSKERQMNSNWKINRVGLVDFWYYDDEEFVFDDGRMLLRGANGSGKSVTMQSLIPLLLDGNMRPERLDAFGTKARKMENYLLEEDDDREERTGYLYMELKREENEEYLEAAQNGDIVEVADALGDMLYILCGTIIEHGMQNVIDDVFEEIHRSNLSKLDENGQPIYREDGKVIKGPNYFPPNLKKFFEK